MLDEEKQKLKAQEEELLKQKELEAQEAERIAKFVDLHATQNAEKPIENPPELTAQGPIIMYEGAD